MSYKPVNHSHLTAKPRTKLSYPMRWLHKQNLFKGRILDFGCGLGSDVKLLSSLGYDIIGYDNFYFPECPQEKFDTIVCSYVMNVLQPDEQPEVLMNISELLKDDGCAFYAVRRDIKYEGFRIHKVHKKSTFQCIVKLPYASIFLNDFCEIYQYQHYNQLSHDAEECPFCNPTPKMTLLSETAKTYAILDIFPVSLAHSIVIPKRHVSDYFDLTLHEQRACWMLVNRIKKILDRDYNPEGYNIGINVNQVGGQTIPHVHIHIIPRYKNDVKNPTGGVRNVIPQKGNYLIDK